MEKPESSKWFGCHFLLLWDPQLTALRSDNWAYMDATGIQFSQGRLELNHLQIGPISGHFWTVRIIFVGLWVVKLLRVKVGTPEL